MLLMEEIPNNHLECINLVNRINYLPTGHLDFFNSIIWVPKYLFADSKVAPKNQKLPPHHGKHFEAKVEFFVFNWLIFRWSGRELPGCTVRALHSQVTSILPLATISPNNQMFVKISSNIRVVDLANQTRQTLESPISTCLVPSVAALFPKMYRVTILQPSTSPISLRLSSKPWLWRGADFQLGDIKGRCQAPGEDWVVGVVNLW